MGGFHICPRLCTVSGTAGIIHQTQSLEGKPDSSAWLSRAPSPTTGLPPRPWPIPSWASSGLQFSASLCHTDRLNLLEHPHLHTLSSDCLCPQAIIFLDNPPPPKKKPHTHHSFLRKVLNSGVSEVMRNKGSGGSTFRAPP